MPETPPIPEDPPLPAPGPGAAESMHSSPEAETPQIAKERPPMLDIHLPHPTHTWKDFWIHLGTIAVGLLIAIGLEQGVEKLHHLEQGRRLAADLQQEALLNRGRIAFDEGVLDKEMAWLQRLRRDVIALRDGGAKQSFVYPERPEIYPTNPTRAVSLPTVIVWATAKDSDLLQLLPAATCAELLRSLSGGRSCHVCSVRAD